VATGELLEQLGITALAGTPVAALSGGEQQRVALACALVHRPRLLLLDEPTNQLDAANRDAGMELLDTVRRTAGATMVIATHDPAVTDLVDQVIDVNGGELSARPRSAPPAGGAS
jgi:putative ABC transport system ATP-binding protein